jgi:hypothetical protein
MAAVKCSDGRILQTQVVRKKLGRDQTLIVIWAMEKRKRGKQQWYGIFLSK